MDTQEIPFIKDTWFPKCGSPPYLEPAGKTDEPLARGGAYESESSEYADAEGFVAAPHFLRWTAAHDRPVDRIVIHITAGQSDYRRTVHFFQNPTRHGEPIKVSAHYVVGREGEVVQMVRHNDIAYHASSANRRSIGIEHCARPPRTFSHDDLGIMPTASQYESSARLVRFLCELYSLPMDRTHILGHVEADPGTSHTDCPVGAWDWDQFMAILNSLD